MCFAYLRMYVGIEERGDGVTLTSCYAYVYGDVDVRSVTCCVGRADHVLGWLVVRLPSG
jgi:hypothetical protein